MLNPKADEIVHLLTANNLKLADEKCTEYISQNPADPILHHLLGRIKKMRGDLTAAQTHLQQTLRLDPNNSDAYNDLGSLYYTQGIIKQAMSCFEKAIRLDPANIAAHYNLANCHLKCEMPLLAISHYQSALRLNPNHSLAKNNLAMTLVSINDYAAALPFLIEVAPMDPDNAELQGHLAEAYLEQSQTQQAIEQYIKALQLQPDRAEWEHNLAVLYLREHNLELAKQHFTRTLLLQPNNTTAQHMLNALNSTKASTAAPAEYVRDLFDQYAPHYNQQMTQKLQYKAPALLRQAVGRFITSSTKQLNVLDLGCGTGLCGVYFRDLAGWLVGVDISNAMLQQANSLQGYDALCCCDILQTIPGLNRHIFDLIIAADVFVYIGDLEPLFVLLVSALRTNGKIAFTVEQCANTDDYQLQATGRFAHNDRYIRQLCSKHNVEILVANQIVPRTQNNTEIQGLLYVVQLIA